MEEIDRSSAAVLEALNNKADTDLNNVTEGFGNVPFTSGGGGVL